MKDRKRGKMSLEIRERIRNRIGLLKYFHQALNYNLIMVEKEFLVNFV